MTTYTPHFQKAFTATAASIALGVRVKYDSNGLVSAAGATEAAIGTTLTAFAASGTGTVLLFGPSRMVTVSAAVARGGMLYPTASGRVDDTGTTAIFLVAGEVGSNAGDIIEAFDARLGA